MPSAPKEHPVSLRQYSTVGPLFWGGPQIQPTFDQKYLVKNSKKLLKAKLEFAAHRQLFTFIGYCK